MGDEELSEEIRRHLEEVRRRSGLPDTGEARGRLEEAWAEKRRLFEEQTRALRMEPAERLPRDGGHGALVLTLSGSLVSLGRGWSGSSLEGSGRGMPVRRAEYSSLELRQDVPHRAVVDEARLAGDVLRGRPVEFEEGPVRSTSPALAIAVCAEGLSAEEEARQLEEATRFLTNGFARIHRTVLSATGELPERFTAETIAAAVADRSGLTRAQVRRVIREYLELVEAGLLAGQRVPLGPLGRLSLRLRPARKARLGLNPATGQQLLLPARPPSWNPRLTFSARLRARAASRPVEEEGPGPAGGSRRPPQP